MTKVMTFLIIFVFISSSFFSFSQSEKILRDLVEKDSKLFLKTYNKSTGAIELTQLSKWWSIDNHFHRILYLLSHIGSAKELPVDFSFHTDQTINMITFDLSGYDDIRLKRNITQLENKPFKYLFMNERSEVKISESLTAQAITINSSSNPLRSTLFELANQIPFNLEPIYTPFRPSASAPLSLIHSVNESLLFEYESVRLNYMTNEIYRVPKTQKSLYVVSFLNGSATRISPKLFESFGLDRMKTVLQNVIRNKLQISLALDINGQAQSLTIHSWFRGNEGRPYSRVSLLPTGGIKVWNHHLEGKLMNSNVLGLIFPDCNKYYK